MDKEQFKQLTQDLIRYSPRLERDVLRPKTTPHTCEHCNLQVVNQLVVCEAHRLGTDKAHFKHKCLTCRMTVYDGSFSLTPRALRPFSNYTPKKITTTIAPSGRKVTKNGKFFGRPRKDDEPKPETIKRAVGRPRKDPT
jgi:hypothetical protein